jgi:DNA-binding NtrC family response regulator
MEFLTPPFEPSDILHRIQRLLDHDRPDRRLIGALKREIGLSQLVGNSVDFTHEVKAVPKIARSSATVLITGETGTGKELFARAVHYLSPRQHCPFVPVNCGALPGELAENELFGHDAGAFTSALTARGGLIREADGGTLFLDEIDCLPPLVQVKLLRFLQEKEYRPLGSSKVMKADVRIIAASNVDLDKAVHEGKVRQDLYYRINILSLKIPPLRERLSDIPDLTQHFIEKHQLEGMNRVEGISPEALQKLQHYDWPGNVRELEHVIERSIALCEHSLIDADDISLRATAQKLSFQEMKAKVIADFEKRYIEDLLALHRGNISEAARAVSKNRRTLFQLIKKYNIEVHPT